MSKQTQAHNVDVLDLSTIPPIYVLSAHILSDDLHHYEDQVYAAGGALTYNAKEARVFLGKIGHKKRAAFELRSHGIWTEEDPAPLSRKHETQTPTRTQPERKRRKLDQDHKALSSSSSTASEVEENVPDSIDIVWPDLTSHILVLKLEWLDQCLKSSHLLPYTPHHIYSGKLIPKPLHETSSSPSKPTNTTITYIKANPDSSAPASSSLANSAPTPSAFTSDNPRRFLSSISHPRPHPPKLHRTTTSEHEALTRTSSPSHPALPSWTQGPYATYSCCRSTFSSPPNALFISQLNTIKLSRILTLDPIGVRAYSTAIASLSALPFPLTTDSTILHLPGCNTRIAELWREWHDSSPDTTSRSIQNVSDLLSDPDLTVLRTFYNIWGVGADTARKFLYEHHFKDLDDIVEYHWSSLTRVQQIGVKFYEEFLIPIPRAEVEAIASTIHTHARRVCNIPDSAFNTQDDVICVIVGGYRRGKTESGDVDVIISHRSEELTKNLVVDVVRSLEAEGYITHTLTLHTTTSQRDQQTLPFRGKGHGGHGFDSLDKALCVWQDPNLQATGSSPEEEGQEKSGIHRRVDIILSPHRTLGCAILGWSGGTTFQRDIRRFASKQRGWKFDSSGVRDRGSGVVIDLESPKNGKKDQRGGKGKGKWGDEADDGDAAGEGEGDGWQDRERRVMEGIGIGWRPAEERCTG